MEKLLTPEQAAEILSVTRDTVYEYIKAGKLKATKIKGSRLLRIKESDLHAMLNKGA